MRNEKRGCVMDFDTSSFHSQEYIFLSNHPIFLSFFNLNIQFSGIYGKNNPLQDFLSGFLQGIVRKELYEILFICFYWIPPCVGTTRLIVPSALNSNLSMQTSR